MKEGPTPPAGRGLEGGSRGTHDTITPQCTPKPNSYNEYGRVFRV